MKTEIYSPPDISRASAKDASPYFESLFGDALSRICYSLGMCGACNLTSSADVIDDLMRQLKEKYDIRIIDNKRISLLEKK